MKLALKLSTRLLAVFLIIGVPLWIIIREFGHEEPEVVKSGIGIIPAFFTLIILLILLGNIYGMVRKAVENDRTQRLRIVFGGLLVITVFVTMFFFMKALHTAIEISAENFMSAVSVYVSVSLKIVISAVLGVTLIVMEYTFIK